MSDKSFLVFRILNYKFRTTFISVGSVRPSLLARIVIDLFVRETDIVPSIRRTLGKNGTRNTFTKSHNSSI